MSDHALLPPNATTLDQSVIDATRLPAEIDGDIGIVGRVADCPENLLPWLAWAMSVDVWDAGWSVETQRAVIASSVAIHRRKGTVGSVRRAIVAFGFGVSAIAEGRTARLMDGSFDLDGSETLGGVDNWAKYRVYLSQPISTKQADVLRSILAEIAPARCELAELNFVEAANQLDGSFLLDGTFNLGVA